MTSAPAEAISAGLCISAQVSLHIPLRGAYSRAFGFIAAAFKLRGGSCIYFAAVAHLLFPSQSLFFFLYTIGFFMALRLNSSKSYDEECPLSTRPFLCEETGALLCLEALVFSTSDKVFIPLVCTIQVSCSYTGSSSFGSAPPSAHTPQKSSRERSPIRGSM